MRFTVPSPVAFPFPLKLKIYRCILNENSIRRVEWLRFVFCIILKWTTTFFFFLFFLPVLRKTFRKQSFLGFFPFILSQIVILANFFSQVFSIFVRKYNNIFISPELNLNLRENFFFSHMKNVVIWREHFS